MAKISAHGATDVARVKTDDKLYVLCSDRRVLRRFTGTLTSGYSVIGKVKEMPPHPSERQRLLERVVARIEGAV